jgi:DNA polymerase-3 subunit alpha
LLAAQRARRYSEEQYLKSPAEMRELFADAPELLANTVEVAKRCSLEIRLGASMLPAYPVPAGRTTEEFLRDQSRDGLRARFAASQGLSAAAPAAAPEAAYEARVEL